MSYQPYWRSCRSDRPARPRSRKGSRSPGAPHPPAGRRRGRPAHRSCPRPTIPCAGHPSGRGRSTRAERRTRGRARHRHAAPGRSGELDDQAPSHRCSAQGDGHGIGRAVRLRVPERSDLGEGVTIFVHQGQLGQDGSVPRLHRQVRTDGYPHLLGRRTYGDLQGHRVMGIAERPLDEDMPDIGERDRLLVRGRRSMSLPLPSRPARYRRESRSRSSPPDSP